MAKAIKFEDALRGAVHVSNEVDLKTAIQQGKLVIISSDSRLYARMLEKFPKEKATKTASRAGKAMIGIGIAITVATAGLFGFVGVPLAGLGLASEIAGSIMDDYKNYVLRMDYEKKQVQFIKTKGDPHVKI